ncbi:protein kinase [Sphaerisporangium sp. B11E5]|uniref:serine/threonine-protein kinase n=1 Tax=Sphaerisporangium sp. B11E5 TaxID=3153563 RepID=UPI00325F2FE5
MSNPVPLRPGDPERVGEYELASRLGEGGQGVVYLGRSRTGAPVAVKLLRSDLAQNEEALARFVREVSTAERVATFCTAQVIETGVAGHRPYIVSEYIDGPTLDAVVSEDGPRRGAALYRLAIGTVTALVAIHQAGIVHRDFKPSNVLLAADGPRVIDFGIAKALDKTSTLTSMVVGTPAYMTPEQLAGQQAGPAADMFAWAGTMIFAATGDAPFGSDSLPAVFHRIMSIEPDLTALEEPLRGIVAACLAKDAATRPSAGEVLMRLLGQPGAAAPGAAAPAAMLAEGTAAAQPREPAGLRDPAAAAHEPPVPRPDAAPARREIPAQHHEPAAQAREHASPFQAWAQPLPAPPPQVGTRPVDPGPGRTTHPSGGLASSTHPSGGAPPSAHPSGGHAPSGHPPGGQAPPAHPSGLAPSGHPSGGHAPPAHPSNLAPSGHPSGPTPFPHPSGHAQGAATRHAGGSHPQGGHLPGPTARVPGAGGPPYPQGQGATVPAWQPGGPSAPAGWPGSEAPPPCCWSPGAATWWCATSATRAVSRAAHRGRRRRRDVPRPRRAGRRTEARRAIRARPRAAGRAPRPAG